MELGRNVSGEELELNDRAGRHNMIMILFVR